MSELSTILTKSQMSGDDIQSVIKMIDQESANAVYQECAEEFDFKIAIVESVVFSTVRELAPIFGYSTRRFVGGVLISAECCAGSKEKQH